MREVEQMVAQLDALLIEGQAVIRWTPEILEAQHNYAAARTLATRLSAAVERIAPPDSVYTREIEQVATWSLESKLEPIVATAIALREDLNSGWARSVVELVHADIYSDYLDMADELLVKDYKDAAAVITGTSLEVHVRALCVKHDIDTELPDGSHKKANVMNADLKRAGVYGNLEHKQLITWMDIRNSAAHGNYSAYDAQQVRHFINGLRDFMMKYPA
ncbi:hypothetical protein [Streptomyces sp. NPDC051662]|uniref:hypothetical protein n=1 Tax=Streptomyces sp. NPDC051662 TaxID=3154750 RepID=UPI00341C2A5D